MVFFKDADRGKYLELLDKYKRLYDISLVGYSLMGNHVHMIPIPKFDTSLAKGIGRVNNDFSRWQNVQCNQTGHLWQARFYSCPVDLASQADLLAYVELNPLRAGIVERPGDWKWSSARAHLTGIDETGLLDMQWWRSHFAPDTWADYLRQKLDDSTLLHRIRTATHTGRPFASEEGLKEMERLLGRPLRPRNGRMRTDVS
jgi:putative transposase